MISITVDVDMANNLYENKVPSINKANIHWLLDYATGCMIEPKKMSWLPPGSDFYRNTGTVD